MAYRWHVLHHNHLRTNKILDTCLQVAEMRSSRCSCSIVELEEATNDIATMAFRPLLNSSALTRAIKHTRKESTMCYAPAIAYKAPLGNANRALISDLPRAQAQSGLSLELLGGLGLASLWVTATFSEATSSSRDVHAVH